ncbi:MAG: hypothetical protein V4564_04860 [Pseudomonadota bacterium]|uniref:hypothetical protein n=1 Tax=Sphingomonas sp. ERG5 TaxID=1381597 RepID=UPI000A51C68E|nr:hypothetical protein [Sphingomonas sp. ERG5]
MDEPPPDGEPAADIPVEPARSGGVAAGAIAPPIDGGDAPVAPGDLQRAAVKAATAASGLVAGVVSEAIADTGAALRRAKMQLYSRMMTDLSVLTQNERLPTDAEIDEALQRAARAQGLPLRAAGSPDTANEARGMAGPRRVDEPSGAAIPDQFVVPADQSRQTISGTGTVEDFIRGKGEPENGNPATRLSKVNAYRRPGSARSTRI